MFDSAGSQNADSPAPPTRGFDDVSADRADVSANPAMKLAAETRERFHQSAALRLFDPIGESGLATGSLFLAQVGFSLVFGLCGIVIAVGYDLLARNRFPGISRTTATFVDYAFTNQFIVLPAVVISGMVIAASMLRQASVVVRVITAALTLLPGCFVYDLLRQGFPSRLHYDLLYDMLLAYFVFAVSFILLL